MLRYVLSLTGVTWPMNRSESSNPTGPVFENCFCFFELEGVVYDFKVIKIKKHPKKIFDLSYWTGLYDQNCRIYTTFCRFGHTGPMVTRYTGGLSQLLVVKMNWGKKSKKKASVMTNFRFLVNFIRHTGPIVTMVTMVTTGQKPIVLTKVPIELSSNTSTHDLSSNFCDLE